MLVKSRKPDQEVCSSVEKKNEDNEEAENITAEVARTNFEKQSKSKISRISAMETGLLPIVF